jgi:hypothetical protein
LAWGHTFYSYTSFTVYNACKITYNCFHIFLSSMVSVYHREKFCPA